MIHRVTCSYCDRPIVGRVIKDSFKMTTCQDCLEGKPITPVVAAPAVAVAPVEVAPVPRTKKKVHPTTTCKICGENARCVGLCMRHYQAQLRAQLRARQPEKPPKVITVNLMQSGCIVVGCSKVRRDRGMCGGHRSYVRRNNLDHLLLPVVPPQIRNIKVRHLQEIEYLAPLDVMAKVVSLKLLGKTWHQAAKEAGCVTPTIDAIRIRNNYRRGKIPGHTPPNPHR